MRHLVVLLVLSHGVASDVLAASLHEAAENGDVDLVREFIEAGADLNAKNIFGDSPLHKAVHKGHLPVVTLLVDSGADIGVENINGGLTPLHLAAYRGHADVVRYLVRMNADVNAKDAVGMTPLRLASVKLAIGFKEFVEIVEFLKQHGGE